MNWHEVESTSLKAYDYEPELKLLAVKFHNESVYVYKNVPVQVVLDLVAAPSIGRYFNDHVAYGYGYFQVK